MTRCRRLVVLILSGCLIQVFSEYAVAQELTTTSPSLPLLKPVFYATYPQIVRIRYLEGDVRVARGREGDKVSGSTWETAVADLPLATGFNLVTGAGRAEIEFEDASTVYLAENSALTFNDIHTTGGVPYTNIALLSGTATLHVRPMSAGEYFTLVTPTGSVKSRYPEQMYVRVTSFVDGSEMTFLRDMTVGLAGPPPMAMKFAKGDTWVDSGHGWAKRAASGPSGSLAAWDAWVDNRVTAREQAEAAMMKASGLTEPIPGLADMQGQGRFFDCAPYGTCWEPTAADDQDHKDDGARESQSSVMPSAQKPTVLASVSTAVAQSPGKTAAPEPPGAVAGQAPGTASASTAHPIKRFERLDFFPCSFGTIRELVERDLVTGKERVTWSLEPRTDDRYDWAVCHAGSWIPRGHHYVWVVGHKRHHHPPIRWVKQGRNIAFVPLHPGDVKGKPPLNVRERAFQVKDGGKLAEVMTLNPKRETRVLDAPPKEFARPYFEPLAKAGDPRLEVRKLGETPVAGKGLGPVLVFDRKSQSFLLERQVTQGSKTTAERIPFNGMRGTLQARVEGVDARGDYSTRSYSGSSGKSSGGSGGGARGGSYGGSGGGGSRGGGGSGGGSSGGSHSSGGGYSGGGYSGGSGSSASSGSSGGGASRR